MLVILGATAPHADDSASIEDDLPSQRSPFTECSHPAKVRFPMGRFARVDVMAMPADPVPTPSSPQAASASSSMIHPDGMIEIALPGGVSVRVDAHVDSGALHRVL